MQKYWSLDVYIYVYTPVRVKAPKLDVTFRPDPSLHKLDSYLLPPAFKIA